MTELAHNRSFYARRLYIDLCVMVFELYSKSFFKEHFAAALLGLHDDKVPNIRLRLCCLFPQIKSSLRYPSDKELSHLLDFSVKKLSTNEKDCDVSDALEKVRTLNVAVIISVLHVILFTM